MFLLYKFLKSIIWLKKSVVETLDIIGLKDQKWHLHNIQIILKYLY
jgi:hypothetical protein